jgi:hypothetical protein
VITCVLAIFFILITSGTGVLAGRRGSHVTLPWRGFSIAFAFLLLILAMRAYIGRFERLFDDHTIFGGVTYTDAHVTLTGMLVVCAALVLGAVIASYVGATRALACRGDPSGRGLLCRPSSGRLVRQQLYRQTERAGSRAALYCSQHRPDAAGSLWRGSIEVERARTSWVLPT